MCCCSKVEQEIPKKEHLSRQNQINKDMARHQEQVASRNINQNASWNEIERNKQQIAREHTAWVEKMENQKQELILRCNDENLKVRTAIQELQNKQEVFKKSLEREVTCNSTMLKSFISRIEDVKEVRQLQQVRANGVYIQFSSISSFFGQPSSYRSSINQNSEVVVQKLTEIYNFVVQGKYFQRKLLLSLACYLRFLGEVICNGYSDKIGDIQLQDTRQFMRNNLQWLFEQLQQLIELAKSNFKRQRSKILEEGNIDTAEEMKLRAKIDELQEKIQQLLEENTRQKADNDLLANINTSLKEQLSRKEVRGLQSINQAVSELQKAVLRRDEVEENFKKLQKLVIHSNEQVVQVLKNKPKGSQKEKSLLSDQTEPERKQLTQEISIRDEQIHNLQSQLQAKQKRIKVLEQSVTRQTTSNSITNDLIAQKKKFQTRLKEKDQQIKALKQRLRQVQQEGRRDADQLQQVRNDLQKSRSRNIELQNSKSFLTKQINKLSNHAKDQSSIDEQKILTLQMETVELRESNRELTQKLQSLSAKLKQQMRSFEDQLNEEQYKRSEAEVRASRAEGDIQDLKTQLKNETSRAQRLKKDLENEISKTERQKKDIENEIEKIKHDAENWRDQAQKLKIQLQKSREQLSITITQVEILKGELSQRQLSYTQVTNNNNRMRTASFVQHRTLFIGQVLERRKGEKKYLMDAIESLMQREIEKTKMLYEFRRDQKTNFHNYLDGHSNLVLILETQKALIACYYSGTLQEDKPMTEEALIISLDSRKTFYLNTLHHNPMKDPKDTRLIRGMVFDKYFLIFGNAEVRLRTGEARVFSNFGIMSSYFDSRKQKVNALLHEGTNNEVDLINYEVHEVFFNEDYTLESTR